MFKYRYSALCLRIQKTLVLKVFLFCFANNFSNLTAGTAEQVWPVFEEISKGCHKVPHHFWQGKYSNLLISLNIIIGIFFANYLRFIIKIELGSVFIGSSQEGAWQLKNIKELCVSKGRGNFPMLGQTSISIWVAYLKINKKYNK